MAFVFHTEHILVALSGKKAKNLFELELHLKEVPASSVFYHTHRRFLAHHFRKVRFYNDIADWVETDLHDGLLAEKLLSIDLLQFTNLEELRSALLTVMEEHVEAEGNRLRSCSPGREFQFCHALSFVMPTGLIAEDLEEFAWKVASASNISAFFHFIEARLRLGKPTNDFSQWLRDTWQGDLADEIDALDPYMLTLAELRESISNLCLRRVEGK